MRAQGVKASGARWYMGQLASRACLMAFTSWSRGGPLPRKETERRQGAVRAGVATPTCEGAISDGHITMHIPVVLKWISRNLCFAYVNLYSFFTERGSCEARICASEEFKG